MRGRVLDFSVADNTGVISGDDGERYRFAGPAWKAQGAHPRRGVRVDFVGVGGEAQEIYLDVANGSAAAAGAGVDPWADGLDEQYRGLYRSSDERILFGVCGGLAHRFGVPLGAMRVAMLIAGFFVIGWFYFAGILLPSLPTRSVARPGER